MSSTTFVEESCIVHHNQTFKTPIFVVDCERAFFNECLFLSDVVVWEGHGVELKDCNVQGTLFLVGGKGYNLGGSLVSNGLLVRNCKNIAIIGSKIRGAVIQDIREGYIVNNYFEGMDSEENIVPNLPIIEIMKVLKKRLKKQ